MEERYVSPVRLGITSDFKLLAYIEGYEKVIVIEVADILKHMSQICEKEELKTE